MFAVCAEMDGKIQRWCERAVCRICGDDGSIRYSSDSSHGKKEIIQESTNENERLCFLFVYRYTFRTGFGIIRYSKMVRQRKECQKQTNSYKNRLYLSYNLNII